MADIASSRDQALLKLTTVLWGSIVACVVLLALYVSVGRYLVGNMAPFQQEILREINARLDFVLEVDRLEGHWKSFTPVIELQGVRIIGDRHAPVPLQLGSLTIGLDVADSLRTGSVMLYGLSGTGMQLHVDVGENGELTLPGIPAGGTTYASNRLFRFIFNTERLELNDIEITLHEGDRQRQLHSSLTLLRDDDFRRFRMSLLSPSQQSWFRAVAEGTGEPTDFATFSGDFHLEFSVSEVELYNDLAALLGVEFTQGQLQSELWFSLADGRVKAAADFSASDLLFSFGGEPDQEFSMEQLAATVRGDYRDGGWDFGAQDISLQDISLQGNPLQGKTAQFSIAALAGRYLDGALEVRTSGFNLGSLREYLLAEQFLRGGLADVVTALMPSGQLSTLKVTVADVNMQPREWQLSANFSDLSVQSWKGAPGVENANGFLSIGPQQGLVQLKSSELAMSFPAIFHEPLTFSEFGAQLEWQVEEERVHLASGPFTAQGPEGQVAGLFSLDIPLDDDPIGRQIDLMIGLRDSHPRFRTKYLPYTLSPALLKWLATSLGDGRIIDGGLIYRGALRKEAKAHRTVQLYFNLENAELDYHPAWPAFEEIDGTVYIADASVHFLAPRAKLYNSEARDVVVQLQPNAQGQLWLDVQATMDGSAADGLRIVHESPLRATVGDAFSGWQLTGELHTELALRMNLSDLKMPPTVAVRTDWQDVLLDTGALNVQVEHIAGSLWYSTEEGFSTDDLSGRLWGKPLSATVSQGRTGSGLADLDIAMRSELEAQQLQSWLGLDMLRLAEGAADTEMHVIVPVGGAARLEANSSLHGVSLDLPPPYGKPAEASAAFSLAMPLAAGVRPIEMQLNEQLFLDLLVSSEGFQAGALGLGNKVALEDTGRFVVGGRAERVDLATWYGFVEDYLGIGEQSFAAGLLLGVRELEVGTLMAFGQEFDDVRLNAHQLRHSWRLDVATAWLEGRVNMPAEFESAVISLDWLDLEGLSEQLTGSLEAINPTDLVLPPLEVRIAELRSGDAVWGDLSFELEDQGVNYLFSEISGHFRGLQLGSEEGMRIDWLGGEGKPSSHLVGQLTFEDFGLVLANYGYEQVVETSQGTIDLDLSWPGGPTDFELASGTGNMQVAVGEGRFLKTPGGASGTLRVASILNLADFVSRLSLDLSYIFESGVSFDSIDGEILFREDILEVSSVDVLGRSSRFQFVGSANINEQDIEGELVATLPVASNLPWVAALIAGLPAAAAVYVVSKLFTRQMDRFSSAIYGISGPWDDPQVEFERIFDNTAEHGRVVAEEAKEKEQQLQVEERAETDEPESS